MILLHHTLRKGLLVLFEGLEATLEDLAAKWLLVSVPSAGLSFCCLVLAVKPVASTLLRVFEILILRVVHLSKLLPHFLGFLLLPLRILPFSIGSE